MITLPGDIPRIQASEVTAALAAHKSAPAFTIVPAHDELGSNAIICSPPDAVPFRFGEDSFFPHLDAARRAGIAPSILHQPGIAMDIDHPADLLAFLQMSPRIPTRTLAFLEQSGIAGELLAEATAAR
jgi:2-phospho-L-lactate/phosphoenolpyruvate guanylyltransferase